MNAKSQQIMKIKNKGHELGETFRDRHDPTLVDEFVQFSLGVASLMREAEVEVDVLSIMRTSSRIAASNQHPRQPGAAEALQQDEELCGLVIQADMELLSEQNGGNDGPSN